MLVKAKRKGKNDNSDNNDNNARLLHVHSRSGEDEDEGIVGRGSDLPDSLELQEVPQKQVILNFNDCKEEQ